MKPPDPAPPPASPEPPESPEQYASPEPHERPEPSASHEPPEPPEPYEPPVSSDPAVPRGAVWTTVLASGASVLMTLDVTIVNVALPDIGDDLDAGLESLQWVISAYTLAFAALLLAAGSISDRIGRRRVFGAGTAVFTLASATRGPAPLRCAATAGP